MGDDIQKVPGLIYSGDAGVYVACVALGYHDAQSKHIFYETGRE